MDSGVPMKPGAPSDVRRQAILPFHFGRTLETFRPVTYGHPMVLIAGRRYKMRLALKPWLSLNCAGKGVADRRGVAKGTGGRSISIPSEAVNTSAVPRPAIFQNFQNDEIAVGRVSRQRYRGARLEGGASGRTT
jgi:hypothetical protein